MPPFASVLAMTATVKTQDGATISGHVTQLSDFRLTLIDASGQTHILDRNPGVTLEIRDPLSAHQQFLSTLTNEDMHNVTAWLETLQ